MNRTNLKEFRALIKRRGVDALLPQHMPTKWVAQLLHEAAIIEYDETWHGENARGIEFATKQIHKARQGSSPSYPYDLLPDRNDIAYYANLIKIEALRRNILTITAKGSKTNSTYVVNDLSLPATIGNMFDYNQVKITRIGNGSTRDIDKASVKSLNCTVCLHSTFISNEMTARMIHSYQQHPEVENIWVFDTGGGYEFKRRTINYRNIGISKSIGLMPNIFAACDNIDKDGIFLTAILEQMALPSNAADRLTRSALGRAITATWNRYATDTTIDRIIRTLLRMGHTSRRPRPTEALACVDMADLLYPWSSNGEYGIHFIGNATIQTRHKVGIIGMNIQEGWSGHATLLMAALYAILGHVRTTNGTGKKHVILINEDNYDIATNPRVSQYISRISKEAAKNATSTIILTPATGFLDPERKPKTPFVNLAAKPTSGKKPSVSNSKFAQKEREIQGATAFPPEQETDNFFPYIEPF